MLRAAECSTSSCLGEGAAAQHALADAQFTERLHIGITVHRDCFISTIEYTHAYPSRVWPSDDCPRGLLSCHACSHHLLTSSETWSQSGQYCANHVTCIHVHLVTSSYATSKTFRTASFYDRIVAASNTRFKSWRIARRCGKSS